MKRILLIIAASVAVQFAVAQTAQAVMSRFLKQSGIETFYAQRGGRSSLLEAELAVGPQHIPIKVTALYPSQFRVEMNAMGQKVMIIVRDSVAWIVVPDGSVQRIADKEQIAQASPITDLFAIIAPSTKDYDMTYVGQSGKDEALCDVLELVKKSDNSKSTLYFNATSGLLQSASGEEKQDGKSFKATIEFGKYAKFNNGTIEIPTSIVSKSPMGSVTINIKNFELDYPTAAWMFAEPK